MEGAVRRVIAEMWARYFEPINLSELASSVFVSPYHFLRVFTRSTGVTPGKYLSAVRMYEAKRLLLTTSLRVSDIVGEVGYRSLGTFTTRFTRAVGLTPSQYREPGVGELLLAVGPTFSRTPSPAALPRADRPATSAAQPGAASVVGRVELPPDAAPANVFVCVFREPVPQCGPEAYELLPAAGAARFAIRGTPAGRCVVVAVAASRAGGPPLFAAEPVLVTPGTATVARLRLRAPRPTDPPLAVALTHAPVAETRIAYAHHDERVA